MSTFIEKSKESLESLKLIGSAPTGNNDIAIYKVLADYLLINGTIILDNDSKGNLIQKTWYPKDYNDLVKSEKFTPMIYNEYDGVFTGESISYFNPVTKFQFKEKI